ncbi:MAG: protein-glutamate O-methyltransferase CheR [Planctomycetes bacterium]|nr:protein-glutamate O-methyltransferase CheR [Planctomycetota bacterium]
MNVEAAVSLLRDWIGLDAATIGTPALARAIRGRMDARGISDPEAYAAAVRSDPAERDRLVEDVIVAESWFFRDRQVFDFVADVAVTLAPLPGRSPVRILCAPCASGEEPYSVAMALLDAGLQPAQFAIDAVDVSRAALERAHRGRYSANAFRNADVSFRDRWFRTEGSTAALDDRVRGCVRFEWANLLDERSMADRGPYDVVFCRNLLIYLTTEARGRMEQTLDRLLRADGILVLGAAEPPILRGDWIPAGAASLFALRRGVHLHPAAVPAATPPTPPTKPAMPARPPASPAMTPRALAPAPSAPGRPIDQPPTLRDVLEQAGALANARRHLEALELCERNRAALPPSPELFFLMGMLHQSLGDLDRAEGCLHKTLYLDAAHEEALLALALLARQRGDLRMAETYRQSAARVFARKASS